MVKTMNANQHVTYVTVEIEVECIYDVNDEGLVIDKIDYYIPESLLIDECWKHYYEEKNS